MLTKEFQSIIGGIVLILTLFGNIQAQTRIFFEAKGVGGSVGDYDGFKFKIKKHNYIIKANGQGQRTSHNKVTNFRLRLEKDEVIGSWIYFAQYKKDLILVCESGIGDAGRGFITRLSGQTLKTKWQRQISGFNIAKGLIESDSAYLAAIGFIAKINLETGNYIWKHENFYRKYKEEGAFNVFLTPRIKGNLIIFTEADTNNQITANKINGKIIKVSVK